MVADKTSFPNGLYMTEDQYLALDEATDGNYEFFDGYVIMLSAPSSLYDSHPLVDMAGGTSTHSAISARLASLIDQALQEGSCLVHTSDVKVKMSSPRHYFHPDVSVACEQEPEQIFIDPVVVVEVLSPATEKRDRGAKLTAYKTLPTLMEYVLIGSEVKEIIVYRRESNWMPYHYQSGDVVELTSIGVSFPFDAVYRRILPQ
jgi:Uma2 family endonuclease